MLIVGPLNFGSGPPTAKAWLEVMASLMLFFWMIRLSCLAEPVVVWTRISLPVLCLFGYVFARYAACDVKWVARQEMLLFMTYTVVFLTVVNNLQRRWQLQALLWIIVLVAAAEATDGILRYYRGGLGQVCRFFFFECHAREGFQNQTRAGGTFFTPDHFSALLELAFALVVGHVIVLKRVWSQRVILGYLGALILIGLSLSKSRGGWISIGCAVAFLVFLILRGRFMDFRSALVAIIVLSGIVYYLWTRHGLVAERIQDLIQQGEPSRQKDYLAALQMTKDHFLFGVGPQMFGWHYWQYQFSESAPEFAHSELLQTLADLGLVGLVLLGWLLVSFYASAFQMAAPKDRSSPPYFSAEVSRRLAFAIGGTAAVFALTVHALFDFVLHLMGIGVTFVTIAALMYAAASLRPKRSETDLALFGFDRGYKILPLSPRQHQIALSLLAIAFLGFMFLSVNNLVSLLKFEDAERQAYSVKEPDTDKAIEYAESSLRFDPRNYKAASLLADLYSEKSGVDLLHLRVYSAKALRMYVATTEANPYFSEGLIKLANIYIESDEVEKARKLCQKLVAVSPLSSASHLLYGRVCLIVADYPCAKQQLEIASQLGDPKEDPSAEEAIRYLGLIKNLPNPPQPD
jgi:O-antigen ligase